MILQFNLFLGRDEVFLAAVIFPHLVDDQQQHGRNDRKDKIPDEDVAVAEYINECPGSGIGDNLKDRADH